MREIFNQRPETRSFRKGVPVRRIMNDKEVMVPYNCTQFIDLEQNNQSGLNCYMKSCLVKLLLETLVCQVDTRVQKW